MGGNMIGVEDLLYQLRMHWRRVVVVTVISLVLAGVYLTVTKPVYESYVMLRIKAEARGTSVLTDFFISEEGYTTDSARMARISTYAEILTSRTVVSQVMEAIGSMSGETGSEGDYEAFIEKISITPVKNAEVVKVAVTDEDPTRAQLINKELVGRFIFRLSELNRAEKRAASSFLESRVREANQKLAEAENALSDYQANTEFVSPDEHLKSLMLRLTDLKKADEINKQDLAAAQAAHDMFESQIGQYGGGLADNATIRQYNMRLVELEIERLGYLKSYTEEHPKLKAINEQITKAKADRDAEISRVASLQSPSDNLVHTEILRELMQSEARISVAQAKASEIEKANRTAEEELKTVPEKEQGFVRAQRDVNVMQDIYTMLYKHWEDARLAEATSPIEVQLLDQPTLPEHPIKPRKRNIIFLFSAGGFLLGLIFAIWPALWNRRLVSAGDVAKNLGVDILGSVPNYEKLQRGADMHERGEKIKGLISWIRGRR